MHPENTKENTQFGAFLIKNTVYEEQMGWSWVIQLQHHFERLPGFPYWVPHFPVKSAIHQASEGLLYGLHEGDQTIPEFTPGSMGLGANYRRNGFGMFLKSPCPKN